MLDYNYALAQLQHMTGKKGVRKGAYTMFHCPCHNDPGASLGLARSKWDNNKAFVNCLAGCDYKAIEAAIGQGYEVAYANETEKVESKIVATYTYTNQYGAPVFRKFRFEPKAFALQSFVNGKWVNKRPATPVLYRLNEVVHANVVFVHEGEKAVNTMREWGLVATCSYNGASKSTQHPKWLPELYNPYLAGKHVVLLPDNDDAGLAHMQFIYSTLENVRSKTILKLPGIAHKADFYDWQAVGYTLADLKALWLKQKSS